MIDFSYFTTLEAGWLNAWIFTLIPIMFQMLLIMFFKEKGKRLMDTSWYNKKDKQNAMFSSILQFALVLLSIFIPFKFKTPWCVTGFTIYFISLAGFTASFYAYFKTPKDEPVTKGVYKISRNPMYFFFMAGLAGLCVASASMFFFIITIIFIAATRQLVLSEERHCIETYGQSYLEYKKKTARYFLFF